MMIRRERRPALAALLGVVALLVAGATPAAAVEHAPASEVSRAEHFVKKLEERAVRMRGQPFTPGYEENEALRRVKSLRERFPDDPAVEALFQRTRTALVASKGETIEVTPEMLAYRNAEERVVSELARDEEAAWRSLVARLAAEPLGLPPPFPAPSPEETALEAVEGRAVVLEGVEYPAAEFSDLGRQHVAVGSLTRGFYWVDLSGRGWAGAYEALRRYRHLVSPLLPEEGALTVAGRISGVRLLVPEAGKRKTRPASWGWVVEPLAVRVPGRTLGLADPSAAAGGRFAGEERLASLKASTYTVTSVPPGAAPERLVEVFATAAKEKNRELWLSCIDPDRRKGPRAGSLLDYHWEWHQLRFARLYVHVTAEKAEVEVASGHDESDAYDAFFLSDGQRSTAARIAGAKVERATVWTRAWDERGRQYGSPKPRFLKRTGGAAGRWYVVNFEQPF